MKKTLSITVLALICQIVIAGPLSKLKPDQTVLLYPQGQNSETGMGIGPVYNNGLTGPEVIDERGSLTNVGDSARIDLYFPKKPNGQMVIVCPGGGYGHLATYHEGIYVAEWMLKRGISVCVLKYRLPNGHWEVPLTDVQNAFRYCRSHAEEWKVSQLGVMGFSAGGHLAASASTLYVDDITRPDFSILIYPVITFDPKVGHSGTKKNLIGKKEKWDNRDQSAKEWMESMKQYGDLTDRFSLNNSVNGETPVTFMALSQNDTGVPIENSIMYFLKLRDNKVKSEMHVFPEGGHGWGFAPKSGEFKDKLANSRSELDNCLDHWLKQIKAE